MSIYPCGPGKTSTTSHITINQGEGKEKEGERTGKNGGKKQPQMDVPSELPIAEGLHLPWPPSPEAGQALRSSEVYKTGES